MRFVHTADWQIGMRAAQAGARAEEVRQARLAAATRVVDLANERRADFLVLAGDTFEDNAVDPVLVRRVVDLLSRASCPVFVLPGNHDPLGPGSVFRHAAWREAAPRVSVLETPAAVEVAGAVVLPCPAEGRTSMEDPTARIPARNGDARIRIGVAHGSLRDHGFEVKPDDFPIASDAPVRAEVDYLALGHWHSTLVEPSPDGARMAYAGTPEPTGFGEKGSGHALVVTIDGPGRPAQVEVVDTAELTWVSRDETIATGEDVAALRAAIDAIPEPGRALLRLRIEGVVSPAVIEALGAIEELAAARFLLARVERDGVLPQPQDAASWSAAVPDGVARTVVERLLAMTGSDQEPARRRVAARALAHLVATARRVSP
jgi:DNA repair exonuclease SbcCD nuclease subunit